MQLVLSTIAAAAAFAAAFFAYQLTIPAVGAPTTLPLADTIRAIKRELTEIAATPGETAGLVLKDVTVELSTVAEEKAGATATLAVPVFADVDLAASLKTSHGSKVKTVFDAPSGSELLALDAPADLDLSAIVLATRRALLETAAEQPPLVPRAVDVEITFVFVRSASTGGKLKVKILEAGADAETTATATNKVVLAYVDPSKPPAAGAARERPIPPR